MKHESERVFNVVISANDSRPAQEAAHSRLKRMVGDWLWPFGSQSMRWEDDGRLALMWSARMGRDPDVLEVIE